MASSWSKKVKSLKKEWKKARKRKPEEFADIEDGVYTMQVRSRHYFYLTR